MISESERALTTLREYVARGYRAIEGTQDGTQEVAWQIVSQEEALQAIDVLAALIAFEDEALLLLMPAIARIRQLEEVVKVVMRDSVE